MTGTYLSPWNWWRSESAKDNPIVSLQKEIDRIFDDFSEGLNWPTGFAPAKGGEPTLAPRLDVAETDKSYEISVELPGVEEKDLELAVDDGVLSVKGEKRYEKEEKDKKKNVIRVERAYGAFQRSLSLPSEVDERKISAAFANGVLKVVVPKKEGAKPTARKIAISASKTVN